MGYGQTTHISCYQLPNKEGRKEVDQLSTNDTIDYVGMHLMETMQWGCLKLWWTNRNSIQCTNITNSYNANYALE